ncbi:MAG: hypothetical protein JJE52_11030 [Acidimicrobiia bacterium]|nr:hypothetical protein [Acidimicrobiia bacterium]
MRAVPFPDSVGGAIDVSVTRGDIYLLDVMASDQAVVRLSPDGRVVGRYPLPDSETTLDEGMPAVRAASLLEGDGGQVVVEVSSGAQYLYLDVATGNFRAEDQFTARGVTFRNAVPSRSGVAPRPTINGRAVPIPDEEAAFSSVRLVDTDSTGRAVLELERAFIDDEGTIRVEQIVELYEPDDPSPTTRVRVNLDNRHVSVANPFALDLDGRVRVMTGKPERVEVSDLRDAGPQLGALDDLTLIAGVHPTVVPRQSWPCDSLRESMDNTTYGYIFLQKSYTNQNVNGPCAGRWRPSNLTVGPTFPGVFYQWGGFATVDEYNWIVGAGGVVGDVNPNGGRKFCATGIDCSGYVAKVWGVAGPRVNAIYSQTVGDHYGTLVKASINGATGLNRHDSIATTGHVQMFWSQAPNAGQPAFNEATTVGFNRTLVRDRSWTSFNGRQAYRLDALASMGCW